jgi:Cd2+/Zn2+-exporting ATPase
VADRDAVRLVARTLRRLGEREQLADIIDIEGELAGVPDETQPLDLFSPVAALLAVGPRRRRQQADLLVVADRRDLHAGAPRSGDDVRSRIAALNDAGKTVSVVIAGAEVAGLIAIRDEPRPDAAAGLKALRDAGIEAVMLTGDNERTAQAIGGDLGIAVRAGLLPEDKQRIVRELQTEGRIVAKVGDGINDAPALAAADIGIAMGGGTDVALETADAAILHGRVTDIANLIALSKATIGNIRQNITVALGLKAVFLVTTIAGITGLWPAILADTGATVLVTLNAMRLLAWKPREQG